MEYVEGVSLKEKIKDGPLSLKQIVDYTIQICDGLSKAHQAGIVHRDLKPENIMIDHDNRVRILDFGLAKLKGATQLTKEASTMGTLYYMSPEQFQGEEVDHRADIWATGVLLYEMISGNVPFPGEHEAAVMYSVLNEEPEPITVLPKDTPTAIQTVFRNCLEKEPSDRYESIDELLVDLQQLQEETKPGGLPLPGIVRKPKPKIRTALMALATVLVLATAGYFSYQFTRQAPIEGNNVAIMYIENQTGVAVNEEQVNNIIPQIYKKLFALHKNVNLASPAVRLDLEALQRAETLNKIAATDVLKKADVKYRVTAVVQESDNGLDYILEMTKPGEHPIVWQETLVKPDSVTSAAFSQTLADWIEACISVDELEQRIHKDFNYRGEYTTRKLHSNWQKNNVLAQREFYQGWYYLLSSPATGTEEAIPYFEKALQINPDYFGTAMSLATCYGNTGRTPKRNALLQHWNERIESLNRLEQFWFNYMYNLYLGTYEKAINAIRGVIEEDAYPDLYYYLLGNMYVRIGDYENASLMYEKQIEVGLYPAWIFMYSELQNCYNNLGLWDKALKALQVGLERNPESRGLMSVLMQQYLMLGNKKEADKWFGEYEKVSKVEAAGLAQGYMNYGDYVLTMGDFDKAYDHYQKALTQLDITERQRINVARNYILMRKFNEAENLLLDTKERLSDNPDKLYYAFSHSILSNLFIAQFSYDEALKFAQIGYEMESSQRSPYPGLSNQPTRLDAFRFNHLSRALVFRANNKSQQARTEWQLLISEYQTLISAPSTNPVNYYALGYIYSLKGDVELALEQLETAFEKGYREVMNYRYDTLLDNARSDPRTKVRFAELLKKVETTYPAIAQK